MQFSQKLNFYFSLAYLGFIVATRGNEALSCSKCGCGQRDKCLSLFYVRPLKAASAFAKSFWGMEIAKLLTDNFIKNRETPPARNAW